MKNLFIMAGIPAYNEEKTIAKVILLTKKYVDEVVVVDDGSEDMTAEIAKAVGATVISHGRNLGKGAAIRTIFEYARKKQPDILILLDADLQHDPNEIPKLLEPIVKGKVDIVIGSRFIGKTNIPKYREVGYKMLSQLSKTLIDSGIKDIFSGYRALSRKAYMMIQLSEEGYGTEIDMLVEARRLGFKIVEVPVHIRYDTGTKTSKKRASKQGTEIIATIIRKTIESRPLSCLGIPGVLLFFIGLFFAIELIRLFNATRYFSLQYAILSVGFSIVGMVLITTSLIIYILTNVIRAELRKHK